MPGAKAQVVNLSDAEQQGLEKLIKRHQVGQQIAIRARIVLAAARGQKNKEIAQVYKVNKVHYQSEKNILSRFWRRQKALSMSPKKPNCERQI